MISDQTSRTNNSTQLSGLSINAGLIIYFASRWYKKGKTNGWDEPLYRTS